jgi:hypothetical protein
MKIPIYFHMWKWTWVGIVKLSFFNDMPTLKQLDAYVQTHRPRQFSSPSTIDRIWALRYMKGYGLEEARDYVYKLEGKI